MFLCLSSGQHFLLAFNDGGGPVVRRMFTRPWWCPVTIIDLLLMKTWRYDWCTISFIIQSLLRHQSNLLHVHQWSINVTGDHTCERVRTGEKRSIGRQLHYFLRRHLTFLDMAGSDTFILVFNDRPTIDLFYSHRNSLFTLYLFFYKRCTGGRKGRIPGFLIFSWLFYFLEILGFLLFLPLLRVPSITR